MAMQLFIPYYSFQLVLGLPECVESFLIYRKLLEGQRQACGSTHFHHVLRKRMHHKAHQQCTSAFDPSVTN